MLKAVVRFIIATTLVFVLLLLLTWQASITVASSLRDCWTPPAGGTQMYGEFVEQTEIGQQIAGCAEIGHSSFRKSILALTIGSDHAGFTGSITRIGMATNRLFRWMIPERGVAFGSVQAQISPLPTPTTTNTPTPTPIPPTPTATDTPTPIPPTPTPTPDLPPIVMVDTVSQTVQYSDLVARVTISATDSNSSSLNIDATLPSSLVLNGGCTPAGGGSTCSWQLTGQMLEPNGSYDIGFSITDANNSVSATTQVVVKHEDAVADFDPGNASAVVVESDGGNSGPFSLLVEIREKEPDLPAVAGLPGDIGLAQVSMALIPVGPGNSVSGICTAGAVAGGGYDSVLPVSCAFDDVPVNLYTVKVDIAGDYYTGESETTLVIYDPSLGFTTGGGWFMWPGTSDQTNFGFTVKYNKKGKNIQGNLLLIRKLDDGSSEIHRLKSNALNGLALGSESDFDWASFEGKATYRAAGAEDALGNHSFVVYVEDWGTPGKNADTFWIKVLDKDGVVLDALSMEEPALSNAEIIQSGNIVVPQQGKGKKGGGKASSSEVDGVDGHFMSSFLPFFSAD